MRQLLCFIGLHPSSKLSDTGMHLAGMKQTQKTEEHLFVCAACKRNTVRNVLRWPYNLPADVRDKALSAEEKVKYGFSPEK